MKDRLHKEIDGLKQQALSLVAVVEENVFMAVDALQKRNYTLARKVIDADSNVDELEVDLEEECLKILALYQPVANDLRFIISILKMNGDLERISDLAVNIAERAEFLSNRPPLKLSFDFRLMAEKVQVMLRRSINALVELDVRTAYDVCASDDDIDAMNRTMYRVVEDAARENPDDIERLLHYLGASRHLERIADHATNIAEDVIYLINGEIVRHHVIEAKKKNLSVD